MEKHKILFKEKQRFRKWWLWIVFLGADFIFISGSYMQLVIGRPFGNHPMSDAGLLVITALIVLLTFLYIIMSLETFINKDGVYVRFFPFQWKFKYYAWEDITKYSLKRYGTSIQVAGIGLRFGLFSGKTAYNISGNTGIYLKFKDHSPVFIGTERPQELTEVLTVVETGKNPHLSAR